MGILGNKNIVTQLGFPLFVEYMIQPEINRVVLVIRILVQMISALVIIQGVNVTQTQFRLSEGLDNLELRGQLATKAASGILPHGGIIVVVKTTQRGGNRPILISRPVRSIGSMNIGGTDGGQTYCHSNFFHKHLLLSNKIQAWFFVTLNLGHFFPTTDMMKINTKANGSSKKKNH